MTAAVPDPRFRDQIAERVLVARCENFREVEQQPCTGLLRYHWGQVQAACDTCGGWCGIAVAAWLDVQPNAEVEARVQAAAKQGVAESCPTCVREGGPYPCCRHCTDDPAAHENGQRNHHDLPCSTCVSLGYVGTPAALAPPAPAPRAEQGQR